MCGNASVLPSDASLTKIIGVCDNDNVAKSLRRIGLLEVSDRDVSGRLITNKVYEFPLL